MHVLGIARVDGTSGAGEIPMPASQSAWEVMRLLLFRQRLHDFDHVIEHGVALPFNPAKHEVGDVVDIVQRQHDDARRVGEVLSGRGWCVGS